MNADFGRAATALGLQLQGAGRASDIDTMPAAASRGRRFRAHVAGDHASILMDADLEYAPRPDQALGSPVKPLIESGTRIELKMRIGHKRQTVLCGR